MLSFLRPPTVPADRPVFDSALTAREATDAALRGILLSLFATVPAAAAVGLLGGLDIGESPSSNRLSVGVVIAVTISLGLVAAHVSGWKGRSGAVAALAPLVLWLPFLGVGAAMVAAGPDRAHDPSAAAAVGIAKESLPSLVLALYAAGLPLLLALTAACARHPHLDPLLRGVALAAIGVTGVALAPSLFLLRHADADTYVESLPPARALSLNETLHLTYWKPVTYRRGADGLNCTLDGLGTPGDWQGLSCQPLSLRYDSESDLWTVSDTGSFSVCSASDPCGFKEKEGKLITRLTVADVHPRVAPPLAWTVGAGMGFVLALLLYRRGRRHARARFEPREVEATMHATGWATLPDGESLQLSPVATTAGPVLVERQGPRGGVGAGAYRQGALARVKRWRRGTLDGLREELLSLSVALYALALAVCLLCAAPLATWWLSFPQRLS